MKASPKNNLKILLDRTSIKTALWVIVLLVVWELSALFGLVPPYILPSFSKVMATLWTEIMDGRLLPMVGRSLWNLAEALVLSISLSTLIIMLCQKSKAFNNFFGTIAVMMNSIPSMALLPLIIMWFGIGNEAIMALVTHSVLWTFTIYVNEGISAIPKIYRDFSNNINLGTVKRMRGIYLPALLPNIVSGLKIAWGRAWRSLIGAEIVFGTIGAAGGLGYFININRLNGNMTKVLAGIVVVALIGVTVDYGIFRRLNKKMNKWGMTND